LENNSRGSPQKPFWQRKKTRFLISAVAIALIIVLAFEGISLFWSQPAEGNLVSFVCSLSSSNQVFTVNANINLADGMEQDEAMEVASKVLLVISQQSTGQSLQFLFTNSTNDEKGIWTVEFTNEVAVYDASRTYGGSEAIPHIQKTLTMTINPFDQTVKYNITHS
jgi:hypothetical protein